MPSRLTSPVGSRPLGLARIIVGAAALFRSYVGWRVLSGLTDDTVLRTPYVDWTPDPSTILAVVIVAAWAISALLFMLGWRVPITGSVLLGAIVANLSIDQQTYSNHLYLMAWLVLLMVVADAGAGLSISRTERPVVRWGVLLIMAQLSIVYGFSALTKINDGFLSGEVLASVISGGVVPFPESLRTPAFLSTLSGVVIAVEGFLALMTWSQRFRPAAFVVGFGLHAAITLLMSATLELFIFSIEMLALYPLFLSREKLVVVWDDDCGSCRHWVERFRRLDLLAALEIVGKKDPASPVPPEDVERSLHLIHAEETNQGFRAVTLTLEHLVPTLWLAPLLRIPGISHLADRWYRWQASRRSCLVGEPAPSGPGLP